VNLGIKQEYCMLSEKKLKTEELRITCKWLREHEHLALVITENASHVFGKS
jgi:hypothetical protein